MKDLDSAIDAFPISSWSSKHLNTFDDGGGTDFYADCPFCGGKRKLGISRVEHPNSKGTLIPKGMFHCFRCMEGGHGGDIWTGAAGLPKMVKILEGCTWRQAFALIYELAGLPEPPRRQRPQQHRGLPDGRIRLGECDELERGVRMLRDRHCGHLIEFSYLVVDGPYRERVILPTFFLDEKTGFEAKATFPTQKPPSLYPEHLETDRTVYTIRSWDRRSKRAALTESILDAETFHGQMNAVGCYAKFKPGQITSLLELDLEDLYWMLDGDAWMSIVAGIRKTRGLFRNFIVPMPNDEDPNSVGPDGCSDLLDRAHEVKTDWDLLEAAAEWGKEIR